MKLMQRASVVIALSFFAALMCLIIPVEFPYDFFKPQIPLLVLLYWLLYVPHRVGVATGWIVGLFVDMLQGGLLGLHAMQYAFIAYMCYQMSPRLRLFPLFQQMLAVMIFVGFVQMTTAWADYFAGMPGRSMYQWVTIFTSAMAWPFVILFMNPFKAHVHDEVS